MQDWLEHFESVALLAGWNDHFKLVHLVSTLRALHVRFIDQPRAGGRTEEEVHPATANRCPNPAFSQSKAGTEGDC